ncbi:centrosomal protein of 290 kDa [Epargyreus clarus]|uniref:centrosomal protein of 290 kDa n=1 Tax=Epargyreus clarus TaxID=520877 RepID=UPI003C2F1BFA
MVETDWREILSFSQRELMQADKEKLCESLSWMEADDIELNFTDLKTLFRLAQDILKYKSEQVNNLMGEIEKGNRKGGKKKIKSTLTESPTRSSDSVLETITHQEEVIKANKEILQQLHSEIAELEDRKNKYEENKIELDRESESSRDPLSEMNATAQLENEIYKKNRHIRKLLADVKVLEEENFKLKDKLSQLKDKLKEATQLLENLTEQLFSINSECNQLKEALGKCEQSKVQLLVEIESLKKEINTKDTSKDCIQEDVKSKIQQLKILIKSHKNDIERLSSENKQLKENLKIASKPSTSPKVEKKYPEEPKIKELQDKLIEASNEIEQSANLIQILKTENKQLKDRLKEIEEGPDLSIHENKNESDDGKEKSMITKLRNKLKNMTIALQSAEEMVAIREKEVANIASQLQLVQSEEGVNTLLKDLKYKKRQLKAKDEGIKNLVIEINNLSQRNDELQLENETLRQKLNIPSECKVSTQGILKKYQDMEYSILHIKKQMRENENKLVSVEIDNRIKNSKIAKLIKLLNKFGCNNEKITETLKECNENDSEDSAESKLGKGADSKSENIVTTQDPDIQAIIKENEGLRIGLKEILEFLKDNSTTSSGILSLNCPSLEAVCHSLDARHAAGWFAPHMAAVMDLKAAVGGKDALLTALHESRKETYEVMTKLSKECKKSSELEQKIAEIELDKKEQKIPEDNFFDVGNRNLNEFGYWMNDIEGNIDYNNKSAVESLITKRNIQYEKQLRKGLHYFQEKFKMLYDKLTSLAITAADDHNKWIIQEENYKAEIENLKSQLQQNADDDTSVQSPGLLSSPDVTVWQRKMAYLEESYKHIRTKNENIKNEYSDCKRQMMLEASDYESHIQSLIVFNINLTDKLRNCVPANLFWEQNVALNEYITKYRNAAESFVNSHIEKSDILKRLQEDKLYILSSLQKELVDRPEDKNNKEEKSKEGIEKTINEKQLEQLTLALSNKNTHLDVLQKKNEEIQISTGKIIDNLIGSKVNKEENFFEQEIFKLREENRIIKQENQRIQTELETTLLKLHDKQQSKINSDIEINLLRHQILDLQSAGDNKAIIARLSGEILIAHLQSSEYNKKIEELTLALNKEKHLRDEAENMIRTRQKVLDYYIFSCENKFRNMFEVLQIFRQEYQGSLPLCTIESYITNKEELNKKTYAANEKLEEIEDLRLNLMMKHSVYNQILETAKSRGLKNENICQDDLSNIITNKIQTHELDLCNKKIQMLEESRKNILERCNVLERTVLLINQGQKISTADKNVPVNNSDNQIYKDKHASSSSMDLEDIPSDDDSTSLKNLTFTLPGSKFVKQPQMHEKNDIGNATNHNKVSKEKTIHADKIMVQKSPVTNVMTQTNFINEKQVSTKVIQTGEDYKIKELQYHINDLKTELKRETERSENVRTELRRISQQLSVVNEQKDISNYTIQNLTDSHNQKDGLIKSLQSNILTFKNQIDDFKNNLAQLLQEKTSCMEENHNLLQTLKELENDKNTVITEYKELLKKEREEYSRAVKDLHEKIFVLKTQLEGRGTNDEDVIKEAVSKYIRKMTELEDKCFKLQSNLDNYKTEITTSQSELDRWKDLASERLSKMEQLSLQLKERHNDEVESYKAENQHWLSQLGETQREHFELRSRLTEQKALYVKQLADKDTHIEQLRTVVNNLKTQVMSMQTMLSINDPGFDLSAIVEVEEASDAVSPQGSERLELKFESVIDFQDFQDDYMKMPTTSTAIWHEPLIERLRREKQLMSKQNAILRRQIKAVAARERRARLDAQNLKNQVFRITTSGHKVVTAESAALQNKIATLQAQLTSARRDAHSTVAVWDKWKRAQQAADRWQARYEEKCQEEKKLETSLNLAKSALARLEKEKRVLLAKLSELKSERSSAIEKQEDERPEKMTSRSDYSSSPPPVSTRALLDRIQAQQRHIAALEVAEKGNEPLVSEYERALAEITSLKGQVLKLESTLLESQIKTPLNTSTDPQPELEYWKSYCNMLKEENMQLTLRVNSLETTPASAHQQRINDLEQTVLTLRALVSKLQADQKSGTTIRRADSRPGSGRSSTDKARSQLDSYRTEISNLKRTIQEKDLLLERSKEMLKIAAEREDELLKENALLHRRFEELLENKDGFLSP